MGREVKIGVFAILMIALAWWGIKFLSGYDLFTKTTTYYVSYDNSNGLKKAAPVMMYGVKVGSVSDVSIDQNVGKVVATLKIDNSYKLPSDSQARVYSPGIMSAEAIDIKEGRSLTMIPKNGEIEGVQESAGTMDRVMGEMDFFKEQLADITAELTVTLNAVNALLVANGESITGALSELNVVTHQLANILTHHRGDISSVMNGISDLSQTLSRNSEQFDAIINNVGGITEDLAAAEFAATISELNSLLVSLNASEGTAGMLLNDEQLYANLTSTVQSLDTLLVDLKENPKRYVSFSLFGRKK